VTNTELPITDRTRLRRKPDRGHFDRETMYAILDEGFVCHLGFAHEGRPWAMPMVYARVDDSLFVHGAAGNFTLSTLASGVEVCVTVTLVDAIVLARSVFHHSVNYRTVMIFGQPRKVEDPVEKQRGLEAIVDHVVPGRRDQARPLNDAEVRASQLLRIEIDEASAKIRSGGPIEEPDDLDLPYWGGHIPLTVVAGAPIPDEHMKPSAPPLSSSIEDRRIPR